MKTLPAPLLAKISWRLLPFPLLMYIMAFLDRATVGFAKQAVQADPGLSDAAFAFGAGVFFVGYALLEGMKIHLYTRLARAIDAGMNGTIDGAPKRSRKRITKRKSRLRSTGPALAH